MDRSILFLKECVLCPGNWSIRSTLVHRTHSHSVQYGQECVSRGEGFTAVICHRHSDNYSSRCVCHYFYISTFLLRYGQKRRSRCSGAITRGHASPPSSRSAPPPPLGHFPPFFRSVFNAGCRALLGTINAEQFEREIMRQNVAAPDRHDDEDDALLHNNQEDDFIWVEPEPGVRNPAAAAANGDADGYEPEAGNESDNNDTADEVDGGGHDGGGGAARAAAGAGGRKVSGKRARRGFEERRERQEERRLALQALGQDEWE